MSNVLHILRSEPDDTVAALVSAMGGPDAATVVCLYEDGLSEATVDWNRLLDDIFAYDRVICWW